LAVGVIPASTEVEDENDDEDDDDPGVTNTALNTYKAGRFAYLDFALSQRTPFDSRRPADPPIRRAAARLPA